MSPKAKLGLLFAALAVGGTAAHRAGDWLGAGAANPILPPSSEQQEQRTGPALARSGASAPPSTSLSELEAIYTNAPARADRSAALMRASELADPAAVRFLASAAERDRELGAQAAAALGRVAQKSVAPELLRIATGRGPVLVRANAVRALGRSGTAREAAALSAMVRDPLQPLRVRQEGLLALGVIGDTSMTPAIIATLRDLARDSTPEAAQLRLAALSALGTLATPEATTALAEYAKTATLDTERAFATRRN